MGKQLPCIIEEIALVSINSVKAICLLFDNWRMALTYGLNIGADCIVRSIGYSSNNVRTCSSSKDSSDSSKSIVVLDS